MNSIHTSAEKPSVGLLLFPPGCLGNINCLVTQWEKCYRLVWFVLIYESSTKDVSVTSREGLNISDPSSSNQRDDHLWSWYAEGVARLVHIASHCSLNAVLIVDVLAQRTYRESLSVIHCQQSRRRWPIYERILGTSFSIFPSSAVYSR